MPCSVAVSGRLILFPRWFVRSGCSAVSISELHFPAPTGGRTRTARSGFGDLGIHVMPSHVLASRFLRIKVYVTNEFILQSTKRSVELCSAAKHGGGALVE